MSGNWNSFKQLLRGLYEKQLWFELVYSGTSGTLTPPQESEVVLDQWAAGIDALASKTEGNFPNYFSPKTALGITVTATLDISGNWTLSGVPSSYPICILYVYKISLANLALDKTLWGFGIEGGELGGGDVIGPASAVDSNIAEFNTVSGKLIKDGGLTHADVASAISLKHAVVTASVPIAVTGQALSLVNDAAVTITEIDTGALADSDTVIPTSKAARDYANSMGGADYLGAQVFR